MNRLDCFARLRRVSGALAIPLAALAAIPLLDAASPTFWVVSTQADFLKGDVDNLSIDSDGRLLLGPPSEQIAETSAPFIWALLPGPDGGLWAGSGNEGKVFRIDKSGKTSVFFDAAELEVHALAAAPNGGLYVATSPDGKIYRVGADGTATTFFDPDDKYIWSLVLDGSGNLFAGTGDKGVIYKISPDGKGTAFYKTTTTHVVSLATSPTGDLVAGTESPGRLFRIDRSGKAFVLLDSPFREIHRVHVVEKGVIYAAAVAGKAGPGADRPAEPAAEPGRGGGVPSVSAEITSMAIVEGGVSPTGGGAPPRGESRRASRGAIYRVMPDGLWDIVWESSDETPYDLQQEGTALLVGTGGHGKIFRVSGDPSRATLLSRAGAQQVTAFGRDAAGRTVFATANPGKVFRLASERARRGTYESDVRDASTVAAWGAIRWRGTPGGGRIEIATRSGNTSTPDSTWSDWSASYKNPEGDQIVSPRARYLQWRVTLVAPDGAKTQDAPILTSVTAAYLPRNLRPEVASITVHPPGAVFQRPFSTGEMEIAGYEDNTSDGRPATQNAPPGAGLAGGPAGAPALGRRVYQKGLQTFVWRASDDNDDRLQYDVLYRREGETGWKVLKRSLWDPIFVWDTTSAPDGTYLVKIVASDAPSNSPGTALAGELESTTFEIDNTPPRIELGGPARRADGRTVIAFTVTDAQSPVQRVEYSLDADRWRVSYPKDGIPDSRREEFEIAIEENDAGRSVIIRVTDAMSNVATSVAEPSRPPR
jgi:hypothetical protein